MLSSNLVFGQGQAGIWYFGENAGLDFNVDPAVALTDGSLDTEEGCATVCTVQGDLLFYTDGVTVYNKNHSIMANGDDLYGNASATQSSIIVQQPGSSIIYYIFTVDAHQNALRNGFNYSVVDLSQNGGLGAISIKNSVIYADEVCEKVTAVKHTNGTDYWILMHSWDSRDFYAYLFSASGLSAPVVSTVGVLHNSDRKSAIGYMKTSPDGSKLALAIYTQDRVELFDFNASSGAVSNPIQLNNYTTPYGIEFSPSGEFLYVSLYSLGELYQFDITSNNETTINASGQIVGSGSWYYGALQLAPDNRIYMAKMSTNGTTGSLNLDVLNDPDLSGSGVNFVADSKNLSGRRSRLGLPNFVTSLFTLDFTYQYDCLGDETEFTITSDVTNIADASWDFGDGNTLLSATSPFTVKHVYASAGTFTLTLRVNLITGGSDTISQALSIRSLPVVNDQAESLWEDTQGSGTASGVDLTLLESAVNSSTSSSFVWYSDAALTTLVADPTSVSLTNGQQFWVEVNDGFCSNVAVVSYSVASLPQAVDQDIVLCEDNYKSGIVSNIDLSLLESAITNNNSFAVVWFHDLALSQPVTNTTSRVVSDGEVFYAQVSTGSETSVATVTYTILSLPEGNDISVQIWEDSFGSGSVAGVNLNDYNTQVAGSNTILWYSDASLLNPITDPTDIFVSDQDIYYAYIENGVCINRGSVQFIVRSSPIANDLDLEICEDVYGGGLASNVNLLLFDSTINGGTSSSVSWFEDAAFTNSVTNPSSVSVIDGQVYSVLVQEGSESNSATVSYSVVSLPIANSQSITEFEDIAGSLTALGVDLSVHDDAIMGGEQNSLDWYFDSSLTNIVPDPTNQDVTDGAIFYVLVSNGFCSNVAAVDFSVLTTPVARNVSPEVCEDVVGSATAIVDLTLNENEMNEGNGDSFAWYSDWPTEPSGTPVNLISDPTNVSTSDGDRFFAAVSDAFNTNIAVATYSLLSLPLVSDQNVDVWEDSFGSGLASGVNLLVYNSIIASGSGLTVSWYQDALLTNLLVTPDNVSLSSGDAFYALVDDGNCQASAVLTFNLMNLPEANDLQVQLCEDFLGTASVTSYDLSELETSVNNDPGTLKEWFSDEALTNLVISPMNTTVSDGDRFFVRVSFGDESNVAQVDFTIHSIPDAKNDTITLCESIFDTGERSGVNLNQYHFNITSSTSSSLLWYSDANYSNPVSNVENVLVSDGDVYYVRVWDGTCENFAELAFNMITLPQTLNLTEVLCEFPFGSLSVSNINLTDYNSSISLDSLANIEWFENDQLSIPVANPSDVTLSNQSTFYALASSQNGCENSGRLNFLINSLPEANDLTVDLCEDKLGEGQFLAYDLTILNDQLTSSSSNIVTWYQDADLLIPVSNPFETTIFSEDSYYAKIENTCENSSVVNFIIHEKPDFDLGLDTTIFYTESKILSPEIEIRFLPGTYLWQDGSTNSTYTVYEEGTYVLQFTDFNGCVAVDSIRILVERYRIFVPNAFTPNGDGVNDTFGPIITGDIVGEEMEMFIYNRWGELIYEFTDFGQAWDGTYKGKKVNVGVYVWILIIEGKARKDGNVSLIR
jgi:gliding motility-associated-like protein